MFIDPLTLQPLIDQKLVSVQEHPDGELFIYNYTQKAQFEHNWTPEIKMCRGLILDRHGKVYARPFDKFFNLSEFPEQVPTGFCQAFDKLDGSLGILYHHPNGNYGIATRGSFVSSQARWGTQLFYESVNRIQWEEDKYTYLFEIIVPENRIVVDYGNEKKLVFLGARVIDTGEFLLPENFSDILMTFECTRRVNDFMVPRPNSEGVVLYYPNGFMCKLKYDEYVRLHRLVTGVNKKTIWELLRAHQPFDELIERVPDEFMQWVKDTKEELLNSFWDIEEEAQRSTKEVRLFGDRKTQAIHLLRVHRDVSAIVFRMLDGAPYEDIIWRMIQPKADKPWKEDIDL